MTNPNATGRETREKVVSSAGYDKKKFPKPLGVPEQVWSRLSDSERTKGIKSLISQGRGDVRGLYKKLAAEVDKENGFIPGNVKAAQDQATEANKNKGGST